MASSTAALISSSDHPANQSSNSVTPSSRSSSSSAAAAVLLLLPILLLSLPMALPAAPASSLSLGQSPASLAKSTDAGGLDLRALAASRILAASSAAPTNRERTNRSNLHHKEEGGDVSKTLLDPTNIDGATQVSDRRHR